MILYILIFKEGTHFKIGISESQESRLIVLQKIYSDFGSIDYLKSKQVEGSEKRIRRLERELKGDYCEEFHHPEVRDGYTETIAIEHLSELLIDVERKVSKKHLGLTMKQLRVPQQLDPVKIPKNKKTRQRPYESGLMLLDFFKHPYGQHILALKDLPENNQIILKESNMPGIFNFANSMQKQRMPLTTTQGEQQKKSRWPITKSNYFPTIFYHFNESNNTPEYVRIEISRSFITDFLSGDLKELVDRFNPSVILDITKLNDVTEDLRSNSTSDEIWERQREHKFNSSTFIR